MATSGANPSRPFDEVRIDVPAVVHGYPAPPPLLGGGAAHDQDKSTRAKKIILKCLFWSAYCLVFGGVPMYYIHLELDIPRFHLDSVSVSVNANSTAVWDIGFSISRRVGDLDVWARFMSQDFRVESNSSHSAGNSTVSMRTLFPLRGTSFPAEATLEQVVFQCNKYKNKVRRYVLKAACENVTVGISSWNETQAVMVMKGGPISCDVVYDNPF